MKKKRRNNESLVKVINERQFQSEVIEREDPALVVFVADWSGPCQLVDPILDKLDDDIKKNNSIFKIESEKNIEIIEKYNIRNFPTFLFFSKGEIIDSISGLTSHAELSRRFITLTRKGETKDQQ